MKNRIILSKIFFSTLLFLFIIPFFFKQTYATSCNTLLASDSTIESDCTFDGTVDGFDDGTGDSNATALTIDKGGGADCPSGIATLTINLDQTVAVGAITINCGAIAISTSEGTQKLAVGMPLWMVDADSDGYPATTTIYADSAAPVGGRRKALLTSTTSIDCCESDANAHPNQTASYSVQVATCGGYDFNCDTVETKNSTAIRACNQTGCDAYHWTVLSGFDTTTPACGATQTFYWESIEGTCAMTSCTWNTRSETQACK